MKNLTVLPHNKSMKDIIASISTPLGTGAISIVRMSGEKCLDIALELFFAKNLDNKTIEPRKLYLGDFVSKNIKEKCMMVYFKSPNSYTGEDIVEFQIHGGEFLTNQVLQEILNKGVKLSENGEFSKRAFLNGKMSLDEAEGVVDIIDATSKAELKAGYELMKGHLFKEVESMQNKLTEMIAKIEVTLDYPEYNDEEKEKKEAISELKKILNNIDDLLKNSEHGKYIKSGVNIALVGKPNVGKSSLLNAILGEERAIVTAVRGTTRDTIKETILYRGIKFNFIDTAGLRESNDIVEKIGIQKTKDIIKTADIVVFLLDGSTTLDQEDNTIFQLIKNYNPLIVLNKDDMKISQTLPFTNVFYISALKNQGIEKLKEEIFNRTIKEKIDTSALVLTNQRHIDALKNAKIYTEEAINTIMNVSSDIVNFEIRKIWLELGKITGVSENEKIIDEIFARFCLGK